MEAFERLMGRVAPLLGANIDTDQILPKQFLRTIERTGLAKGLFYDARFNPDGTQNPSFVLNQLKYSGASILLTGPNFGCGSSREHAVWALQDFGIRCLIGSSYGEIFAANAANNGLLTITLTAEIISSLAVEAGGGYDLIIDLQAQTVELPSGHQLPFPLDPRLKANLLTGQDAIDFTLLYASAITQYEQTHCDELVRAA